MLKTLISRELLVQNKIYNLTKYMIMFFLFCSLTVNLINSYEELSYFAVIFSLISIPLAFIGLSNYILKSDIEDGTMEILLSSISSVRIIIGKYSALCISSLLSFAITSSIIAIMHDIKIISLLLIFASGCFLILLSAALIILIASMQGYFRYNTNFFAILIMPLILPNMVLSGILLQNQDNLYLLSVMIGIDLVVIPPSLYFSSYLIENIYNI